jgi:hypothetical protein
MIQTIRKKLKGCIMILAWILFASIGMLFARYYKFILPKVVVHKTNFWFLVHRPLMTLVAILTVIGFILILADLGGSWVDNDISDATYAHAMFGIFTVIFVIIQVKQTHEINFFCSVLYDCILKIFILKGNNGLFEAKKD